MPWNDQSGGGGNKDGGGPWGGGPRQPWGQPPRQTPPSGQGPDLEDILRRIGQNWRNPFGKGSGGGGARSPFGLGFFGALVAIGWLASGIYTVDQGEQAVVTRFGNYLPPPREPGLHWHLPWPVEHVHKEIVTRQRSVVIGRDDNGQDISSESLMLTGDRNIIDVNFTVVWQLSDIERFVFNVRDPDDTVKAVAESAMREVIGKSQFDDIITNNRSLVETETQDLMQKTLDSYQAGVLVTQVQMNVAAPPAQVNAAFQDVIKANQDQITKRNQAEAYRNQKVPVARGDAAAMIQAAEAYREQVVREADGEAQRFLAVLAQYKKAPAVTRKRLYLETMERVYGGANKIIVDTHGSGVQPYLPLDQLRRSAQPQDQAPTQPPSDQSAAPAAASDQ